MATTENWYYTSRGISNKQAVLLVKQALGNNLPGVWPCGAGEMVNFVTERGGIRERGDIAAHAYDPKEIVVAFRRLQGSATRAKMRSYSALSTVTATVTTTAYRCLPYSG